MRQLRIDDAAAAMHLAQRLGQVFGRRVLQQVTADAGIERAAQESGARERGDDDDLDRQRVALDALCEFQPGQPGHLDVGDQHVGLQALQFAPGFLAVGRGAEHLDVGLHRQQGRQRAAHHRLVLGEQDADHERRNRNGDMR